MVIGCLRLNDVSFIYHVVNPHLTCRKNLRVRSVYGQPLKLLLLVGDLDPI